MGSSAVANWRCIQKLKAAIGIHAIGCNAWYFVFLAHGVETGFVRREREESRSADFRGQFGWRKFACFCIEFGVIDSFGGPSSGSEIHVNRGGVRNRDKEKKGRNGNEFYHGSIATRKRIQAHELSFNFILHLFGFDADYLGGSFGDLSETAFRMSQFIEESAHLHEFSHFEAGAGKQLVVIVYWPHQTLIVASVSEAHVR